MEYPADNGHHGFDFLIGKEIVQPIVSFDLFDTIVHRRYLSAHEVHETVSAYAGAMLGRYGADDPRALTSARYQTTDLIKASPRGGTQEPSIDDVWRCILGADIADRALLDASIEQLVRFEVDVEKVNLAVIPGAIQLIDALRLAGKTVIAVSDMYFSDAVMREILAHLGILDRFDHIFVSADHRLTKQTGDLFGHVCTALSTRPGDVLHIGDNATSDYEMARSKGLNALLIAHHSPLQRPAYGRRPEIFKEVSDLNKAFLFDVLLLSRSQRVEHIYFLARDGCLMAGVLDRLEGPIVDNLLGGISYSAIFLNRSLTCWGAINFKRDWLVQAVGFAFWLNGGRVSYADLMKTLGASIPNASDPVELLDSGIDTPRIVSAIANTPLEGEIKAAILRKRAELRRYLTDIGFFRRRRVAFCDLGYSGSAVRDLNLFLVQEETDTGAAVPVGFFNLIASNGNWGPNSVAALPYVRFNPPVLLPSAVLPMDLSLNFAWLELFFKHPTMQPVTGFVEVEGGGIAPDVRHAPRVGAKLPSEQVLAISGWIGSDLALLWMASQRSLDALTVPIIKRFAHPDADTVAQIADAIYEADAVSGETRSAVLIDPNISEDELVETCRAQDYWIAGSKVASAAARAEADGPPASSALDRAEAPASRLLRFQPGNPFASRGVDAEFYRAFYADLSQYDDAFLRRHYDEHGRREGRFADAGQLVRSLTRRHGALPANFSPYVYVSIHHDLRERLPHPLHGYEHYLKHGKGEGRGYLYSNPEIEADFDRLLRQGAIVLSAKERRDLGRKTVAQIVCDRHHVDFGGWVDLLDPAEFKALNNGWVGAAAGSKGECINLFLERGLETCAPLSIVAEFKPEDYRRSAPGIRTLSDRDAYRHWLTVGFYLGAPPSEAFVIHRLIGETEFPTSFDWQGFAATDTALAGASRTEVLAAFARSSGTDAARYVNGGGSAQLLTILGMRAWFAGTARQAIGFLEAALAQGGHPALLLHYLGDAYRASGQTTRALAAFSQAIDEREPNRWSFINGAELALEARQIDRAIHFIDRGRPYWNLLKVWRQVRDRIYGHAYEADIAAAAHDGDPRPALQAAVKRAVALIRHDLPPPQRRVQNDGPVLILTGRPFDGPPTTQQDGRLVKLFAADALDRLRSTLFDASLLVVNDLPVSFDVLKLAITAKALGVHTVYALGRLGRVDGMDLSALLWHDAGRIAAGPSLPWLPQYYCAASVFDKVVTRWAGSVAPLSLLAPDTPIEWQPSVMPRPSSATGSTILLAGGWRIDAPSRRQAVDGLRNWAASRQDAVILVDASFDGNAARASLGCRVDMLDLQHDLDDVAMLMQGIDLVIELKVGNDFSLADEAEAMGVPALVIDARPGRGASPRRTDPRRSFDRLSGLVVEQLGSHEAPANLTRTIVAAGPAIVRNNDNKTADPLRSAPKVLFVNVYFPPQSIGGATRVLKDNLDFFLDQGEDPERFVVVTTDLDNPVGGEVHVDSYRGVRLYRLATPQEIDMDWRTENAEIAATMRRILRHERPDLVHVHCVPRLSVSPVDECRKAGIPYIVTLHDAWWISDYPFLTDRGGLPKDARRDLVQQDYVARIGARRSWSRGFLLREILSGAYARLAVSDSFAQIYRNAGIACDVVENGVSPMRIEARPPRTTDRVNICHVGGMEHHKGAYLLEIALKSLACRHLAVTIIDLSQETGYEHELTWGSTPVRKIGRIPTDGMADLYAGMDVLVAPSTWPESYGLVSREAAKLGLWVIASSCGAMGESVQPGINGFIVNTHTPDDLVGTLRLIDEDHGRFLVSPPPTPMRSSDDQGRELLTIYRDAISGQPIGTA